MKRLNRYSRLVIGSVGAGVGMFAWARWLDRASVPSSVGLGMVAMVTLYFGLRYLVRDN